MAYCYFVAKPIGRSAGHSAVAAAAYRSASRLRDDRRGCYHDWSHKNDVVHSEIMLPDGAPQKWRDRERLWNDVEASELRKDSQLARDMLFAVPRELDQGTAIDLIRDFASHEFVSLGMIADLNVHWNIGLSGELNPHAHIMLTTRHVSREGFGHKNRDWNHKQYLFRWRESWANHANQRLAQCDIEACIDHRAYAAQSIALEPRVHLDIGAAKLRALGQENDQGQKLHAIGARNGMKLLTNPDLALDTITRGQVTFTDHDLEVFVRRCSAGKVQFNAVMKAVKMAPDLIPLGTDRYGEGRYTSLDMIAIETRAGQAAARLAARHDHRLTSATLKRAISDAMQSGRALGYEQQAALAHVTTGNDIAIVVSDGERAKTTMLGIARESWEVAGYRVRGIALSAEAVTALEAGSGIASRTLASLEQGWKPGHEWLEAHNVAVIDEAGLFGTRQIERIVSEAEKRLAKLVLVGDIEQLRASEAGAALRSLVTDLGAVEISDCLRQRDTWQRMASGQLAIGRAEQAIAAYDRRGMVHDAATRVLARGELIERWEQDWRAAPDASRVILAHSHAEVSLLNAAARERMRTSGALGDDVTIDVFNGSTPFAKGDRVLFLRNERDQGIRNGMLGTIRSVDPNHIALTLDDNRSVALNPRKYPYLARGYAVVIDRTQGLRAAHVYVLATPSMDRHSGYLALTRHVETLDLHYGRDEFANRASLVHTLSLKRSRDRTRDYAPSFAERRALIVPESLELRRDGFGGIRVTNDNSSRSPETPRGQLDFASQGPTPFDRAVARYAQAAREILQMRRDGNPELPHQLDEFRHAGEALENLHRSSERDLRHAFDRNHRLIEAAAKGRTGPAIRAMIDEAEVRINPTRRADRFITDWRALADHERACRTACDDRSAASTRNTMVAMAHGLERDPQVELLLRARRHELGIREFSGASLSHDFEQHFSRSRGIGIGM